MSWTEQHLAKQSHVLMGCCWCDKCCNHLNPRAGSLRKQATKVGNWSQHTAATATPPCIHTQWRWATQFHSIRADVGTVHALSPVSGAGTATDSGGRSATGPQPRAATPSPRCTRHACRSVSRIDTLVHFLDASSGDRERLSSAAWQRVQRSLSDGDEPETARISQRHRIPARRTGRSMRPNAG